MSIANTLSINQIYIVTFEKTGQPFITTDGDAIIYLFPDDAKRFLADNPGTALDGPDYYTAENLCSICYAAGAERIKAVMPKGEKERYEDLSKMPRRKFYNYSLNRCLNLLHETKKKEYLYEFKDKKFIVPVKINENSNIVIEYSIAKVQDKNYFLAFSNLDEFAMWSSKVEGYSPLKITYDELVELCKSDDCIINIFGARYILSQDKIARIREHTNQKQENI